MDEDPTRELNARSFEARVFAEFAAMRAELLALNTRFDGLEMRLTTLEDKVDARLRETRPIWEGIQATLDDLSVQLREVLAELHRTLGRVARLEERQLPPAA